MSVMNRHSQRWIVWSIRVLATIEAVDAIVALARDDWLDSNPWLVALTAAGVVGLGLVWLSGLIPGPEWLLLGIGAILVAVAPAILYPLSGLLAILGVAVLVLGVIGVTKRHRDAAPA